MDGGSERARRPAPWRGAAVLTALLLAAFTFNTAESLPIGLLDVIAESLRVPQAAVGLLVTGYGLAVAAGSVPLAHAVRAVPRRHVLAGLPAALVVSALIAAAARSYWPLLGARLLTALAQALFWAVAGPVAVGLCAAEARGRVMGALSVAGSLALVLGVPAGTWLGRAIGWRLPVALLAVLGLVSLVTVAVALPASRPEAEPAAYGAAPDVRRFRTVVAAGALSATGAFAGYTCLVTFLGEVSGFSPGTVGVLPVAFGGACLAGAGVTGALLDRFARGVPVAAVATQAVGLLGLSAAGAEPVAAVVFLVLLGGALGAGVHGHPARGAAVRAGPHRSGARGELRWLPRGYRGGRRARGLDAATRRRAGRVPPRRTADRRRLRGAVRRRVDAPSPGGPPRVRSSDPSSVASPVRSRRDRYGVDERRDAA